MKPKAMDILEKERLARRLDDSLPACAARLKAALATTGITQKEVAAHSKVTEQVISNAKKGLNYPSLNILRWLYRQHRVDFNFMIAGEFSQLPYDVQEKLFAALAKHDAQNAEGQKPS
jgi:transcriptional regulator with XRE-family HTH domain